MSVDGAMPAFTSGGLSPFMTHAAPKWHAAVTQGHVRHARAHVGEAIIQDNCDVMSFSHGGPDMGWGPWEERLFASSDDAQRLGLPFNFSVREYALAHPHGPAARDPILVAFVSWTYALWLDAWRDIADTSRAAAREAGVPEPG